MTSAASLAFPGSRTLAGWWRQLASLAPQAFAVGHLFLHRLEAPVYFLKLRKIDRFALLVLHALNLETSAAPLGQPELLDLLHQRLLLERPMLLQVLWAGWILR